MGDKSRNGDERLAAARRTTAERLRRLRLDRGLRLADVSALSGLSAAHISRIESEDRWPSLPSLVVLAAVYGVEVSSLVDAAPAEGQTSVHAGGAVWEGDEGVMIRNTVNVRYTHGSRTTSTRDRVLADGIGSPEELIGMAFAGCFSMSLATRLGDAGFVAKRVETGAEVELAVSADGVAIRGIRLSCRASVPKVGTARFEQIADETRRSCVVARALAAVPVALEATLV